jgi:hypothetical protein
MNEPIQERSSSDTNVFQEQSAPYSLVSSEIDASLLADSLAKTPWERMQANDDALNFGDSLRVAMKQRRA